MDMNLDNFSWLVPAWILGAPFLFGLFELVRSRSYRVGTHTELR
jgi:hypothetical protein